MINYFKNISSSSGKERMWSSFKDYQNQLKGDGVSNKNFIAINARATNDFANRKYLAYVVNRYLNPCFSHFFTQQGIYLDQDKFAEMNISNDPQLCLIFHYHIFQLNF